MGYYTRFQLEIENPKELDTYSVTKADLEEYIAERAGYGTANNLFCDDDVPQRKWYTYLVDMIEFSKSYPKIIFKLIGEGENNDDLWHCYFQNGKYQMCKAIITYPKFNPDEMK